MDDFTQIMLINMAATLIIQSVKNAKEKVQLKGVMLKIFNVIKTSYAGDPDFQ